ncbi:unnamed protein product [Lactuca virosa]|uniref:Uncharacterized protein n=1 Tax=Lactuca virosa TaxID=75947 RepID=A0AAU9M6S4_9ASTR|nr:unnamed protein product [Lactuca virosa]
MYITPFPAPSLTKLLLQWIAFLSYLRIPIKAMEFNSIHHLFPKLSSPCSHPLFSIIVTLYTLILLYIPSFFISIALSPVLNSTGIILISLLRLGVNKLEKESRFLDSRDNERLAKESYSLESRVLDCNDNHSNLILYSKFAPESKSLESRLIDFVAQNQTHAEFEPESVLDLECNETHVEFEHDMVLESNSIESSQVIKEGPIYEPKSGLGLECNETHVKYEHDMGSMSNSMESTQAIVEGGSTYEPKSGLDLECKFEHDMGLESNSMESLQAIEEGGPTYKPKSGLDLECNETHVEFEHDMVLESNSIESSQVIEGGPTYEPKSSLDLECNETHVKYEHDMGLEFTSTESPQAVQGGPKILETGPKQVDTTMAFLEWNMRAPLEIIYEAYEGEEDDEDSNENHEVSNDKHDVGYERYPSLLMYYPDSETDSSSDGDFPMNEKWETHESVFFKWEDEEEEREELIEISLDHYGKRKVEFSLLQLYTGSVDSSPSALYSLSSPSRRRQTTTAFLSADSTAQVHISSLCLFISLKTMSLLLLSPSLVSRY